MVTVVVVFIYTPNCKNVVQRKLKRGKSQIGLYSANLATFSWWIHLQPLHFLAVIFSFIVFHL